VRQFLVDCPDSAETLVEFGLALYRRGQHEEAAAIIRRAVWISPHLAEPHYNLSMILMELAKPEEALAEGLLALAARRDFPEAWCHLGTVLMAIGKNGQAVAACQQALALNADYVEAWNNLGLALQDLGLFVAALVAYHHAVARSPGFASCLHNMGTLLKDLDRVGEALAAYGRAILAEPQMLMARAALVHLRRQACDWDGLEVEERKVIEAVRRGGRIAPMILLGMSTTPEDQLVCGRNWLAPVQAMAAGRAFSDWPRLAEWSGQPLRIGYLSADFHAHATAFLAAELFERHDRNKFRVVGYSLGVDDGSDMRRRLSAAFDDFVDLRNSTHGDAALRIHTDSIDILVDLKGHSQNARPEILALRPAPVQVAWLGYPATTGADYLDWAIVDAIVAPFEEQSAWSEGLVHLPGCYQANDRRRLIGASPSRETCGLPERGIVFCAFNSAYKLGNEFFGLWMRLLRRVPASVLWLLDAPDPMPGNLRRQAARHGIDPARLVFAPRVPLEDHLARHSLADLFLDVLPCCAHTTASDALWAGLPVLTVKGATFSGRVAASLLTALDLPELIAGSLGDYEAKALHYAEHPAILAELREKLIRQRGVSTLFDGQRFARNLEAGFSQMWELVRSGRRGQPFTVSG